MIHCLCQQKVSCWETCQRGIKNDECKTVESGGKIPSITKLKRDSSPKQSHSFGGEEGEAQETMCWDQACDKGMEERTKGARRAGLCPVPPHFSEQQRWSNNRWTVTVFSSKILYVLSEMAGRRGKSWRRLRKANYLLRGLINSGLFANMSLCPTQPSPTHPRVGSQLCSQAGPAIKPPYIVHPLSM